MDNGKGVVPYGYARVQELDNVEIKERDIRSDAHLRHNWRLGCGTGTPNSAAQVDGNFYDVDQRIVDLVADLAEGKQIDTVNYTSIDDVPFTDGSSQVIPLPVATLEYVGAWTNNTPYQRGQMIVADTAFIRCWLNHTMLVRPAPSTRMPRMDRSARSVWMPICAC